METGPDNSPSLPEALDTWLKHQPVRCSDAFQESLRARLKAPHRDLDATLDVLLRMQPNLHNPALYGKIRARLEPARSRHPQAQWIHVLRPIAAAALLSLTFWAFQQEPANRPLRAPATAAEASLGRSDDADLHLIFALASSVESGTNLAQIETSPDQWAFLLD